MGALLFLQKELKSKANPAKAELLQGFFKTGKGEYGEGDIFLGITVPVQRIIAKKYSGQLPLDDLDKLIKSKIHEERLIALLILIEQFQKSKILSHKSEIYKFYLSHIKHINNWDLVDLSAPKIVGAYLRDKDKSVLYDLVRSENVWERRIAILATFDFICQGKQGDTVKISNLLLNDSHDLIHKAVGWMLREMGKRCGESHLTDFLDRNAGKMPRTMLRYSIEHLSQEKRKLYLAR